MFSFSRSILVQKTISVVAIKQVLLMRDRQARCPESVHVVGYYTQSSIGDNQVFIGSGFCQALLA